jgi:hypothetical protein
MGENHYSLAKKPFLNYNLGFSHGSTVFGNHDVFTILAMYGVRFETVERFLLQLN